jgi:hypothetical protein
MRPWRRTLVTLLHAATLALAACAQTHDESCPGRVIAALALHGQLDPATSGCAVPPADGWTPPDTLPVGLPDGTFDAVFAWDDGAQQLAYCTGGSHAAVLRGTQTGDHLRAEVTLPGAVLAACAATCTPLMTVVVEGDLAATGSPVAFSGTLTETFDGSTGDCGPCQLPCRSTYVLTGTGSSP